MMPERLRCSLCNKPADEYDTPSSFYLRMITGENTWRVIFVQFSANEGTLRLVCDSCNDLLESTVPDSVKEEL